jgi:regulator of sirC expression with transglutaminase-like and TPR domain
VPTLRERFTAAVAGGQSGDVAQLALAIAAIEYPQLDPAPTLYALDRLADAVAPRLAAGTPAAERATELAHFLFRECGFQGNREQYYDPRNSCLNDVVERRTGIPISLSVVMIEVGARVGLDIEGVGFPGHFLVRVPGNGGGLLLDPFDAGHPVDEPTLLARLQGRVRDQAGQPVTLQAVPPEYLAVTPRLGIAARMLRNLLAIYLQTSNHAAALSTVDLLLVLGPRNTDDLRTRGLLYERLDCHAAAAEDLRRYLDMAPEADDAAEMRGRLSRLADHPPTFH